MEDSRVVSRAGGGPGGLVSTAGGARTPSLGPDLGRRPADTRCRACRSESLDSWSSVRAAAALIWPAWKSARRGRMKGAGRRWIKGSFSSGQASWGEDGFCAWKRTRQGLGQAGPPSVRLRAALRLRPRRALSLRRGADRLNAPKPLATAKRPHAVFVPFDRTAPSPFDRTRTVEIRGMSKFAPQKGRAHSDVAFVAPTASRLYRRLPNGGTGEEPTAWAITAVCRLAVGETAG